MFQNIKEILHHSSLLSTRDVFPSVDKEPRKRSLENFNIIFLKILELSKSEQETEIRSNTGVC